MPSPVIVGAARTAIGRSFKGTLVNTPPEELLVPVLAEVVRRAGLEPTAINDLIIAESNYGGGDLARYCADILTQISSVHEALRAVGRELMRNHLKHCASTAIVAGGDQREAMYDELVDMLYKHSR